MNDKNTNYRKTADRSGRPGDSSSRKKHNAQPNPRPRKKVAAKPGPMLYPLPLAMVSCGSMEESNIITVAWTGIINTDPPMTYVSLRKSRYSHDIIRDHGEFVINLTSRELVKACDFCGVRSGRDLDKFRETGLKKEAGDIVSAPMIAESPVSLECVVKDVKELPSHDMFLAEIVSVHIDEAMISPEGRFRFEDMHLVTSCHGEYLPLGHEALGFFGYSVMKPKTKKRLKGKGRRK